MPKETFRIEGTGTLDISQINNSINKIQSTLSKIKLDDNLSKSFKNTFNELENQINKFNSKMEQGFNTKSDISGLQKNIKSINTLLNQLNNDISKVKKIDLNENIKIDSSTSKTIKDLDSQIQNLQNKLHNLNSEKLETITNIISQFKTKGAKNAGQGILEAFNNDDIEEAIRLTDKLTASQKRYQESLEEKGKNTSNIKSNLESLDKLSSALKDARDNSEKFNNEINEIDAKKVQILEDAVDKLKSDFSSASDSADSLTSSIKNQTDASMDAANAQRNFNNELEEVKNNVANFFSLANGIDLFRQAVRQAVDTVKELDATMTEAATVTDFSVADMWAQLPTYSEEASKLGAEINDLYGATTLYFQQGLNTNQAMDVGVETMKMARVAAMDSTEATKLMTAALRGFNMELNQTSAQRVNDVYSELAAITAADTGQIGTAMSKTASIAASANMEFETTAAFLAQIIETTQEAPETAGTALKTIIARFTEVSELFDQGLLIGEDSEGQEININKIDEALQTVGISLKNFLTGAEGLDEILLELASKWDTLDLATQRYIATTAAGSRQQSRFLAMMSDYDRTVQLVDAAYNSAGASQEQFNKTLDSLESKINKLLNAWNSFTMGIANNQLIKGAVDAVTDLLNGINDLADAAGPAGGAVIRLLAAFTGFTIGKNVLQNVMSGLINTFSSETLEKKAQQAGMSIGEVWSQGVEKGSSKFRITGLEKLEGLDEAKNKLKNFYNDLDNGETSLSNFANSIKTTFSSIDGNTSAIKVLGNSISNDLTAQLKLLRDTSSPTFDVLKQKIDNVAKSNSLDELTQNIRAVNNEINNLNKANPNLNLKMNFNAGSLSSINKGFSKFTTITSQAASGISDLGSLFTTIGGSIGKFGLKITGLGSVLMDLVGIAGTVKGVIDGIAASAKAANISMASLLIPIGLVGAALAALGGIAWASWYFSEAETLKRELNEAKEATEATAQAAEDAKQAYDDIISAFDSYHTATDALNELTEGTLEWKNALLEVNSQVLDLISKYPELAKYVTRGENGALEITPEGEEAYIEERQQSVNSATTANLAAQAAEMQVQQEQDKYNLEQQLKNSPGYRSQASLEDILNLYNTSPEAFISKSFNPSELASATNEEIIKLFEQNLSSISDLSELKDYINIDDLGSYEGIKQGYEDQVVSILKDSNTYLGNQLQSYAEQGNLSLYSDQLMELSDGMTGTAKTLVNMSDDIAQFSVASSEADSSIQGLIDTMLNTNVDESILQDKFGSKLTKAFSNIVSDNMSKSIDDTAKDLKDNNSLEELQNLFKSSLELSDEDFNDLSEDFRNSKESLANAIASFNVSEDYANALEETFNNISQITDEKTKKLAENFFSILSEDFDSMSKEDINTLLDIDPNSTEVVDYVKNIIDSIGYTVNDSGVIEELGISLDDLTSDFTNAIDRLKKYEVEVNDSLGLQIAKSGSFRQSNNSQDVLTNLLRLDTQQKSNIAELSSQIRAGLGEQTASNFMEGMIDIYLNGTDKAQEEIQSIFSDVDFSNPIQSFNALQKAIQSTEQDISNLGGAMLVTSGNALSTANQFQYFLKSSDFSDLNEQISEFVEENGSISSSNINELASSCASLKQMLDQTGMSANTTANLINGIQSGKLGIEDITDSLIIAISAFGKLDEVVENAFNTIDNFDPGRDTGEIGDWVNNVADTVIEMYDNGEYGNEQLQNYLKLLFGEDQWNQAVKSAEGNLDRAEESFVNRLRVLEGNLYGAWHELATSTQYQENLQNFNLANDTNIQISELDDGSISLLTNGATTDQVVESLAQAYNISKEYAEMMLTDFYNFSGDLKTELAANDWAAGIEEYVQSRTVTSMGTNSRGNQIEIQTPVFSDKEISNIAGQTGLEDLQIWKDIAEQLGIVTDKLNTVEQVQQKISQQGAVLQLLNKDGTTKAIDDIIAELNTKLGGNQLNGIWANMFNGLRKEGEIAVEDIYNFLQGLGLDDSTISQITYDAVQALENAGQDTEITVGGVALSEEEKAQLETDTKGVIEQGADNADMTAMADAISTAVTEGITGVDDSTWFSGLSEAASTNIQSAYQQIKEGTAQIVAQNAKDTETMSQDYADAASSMSKSMSTASSSIQGSLSSVQTAANNTKSKIDSLRTSISNLSGKTINITADLKTNYKGFTFAGSTYTVQWFAKGTSGLSKDTLGVVGDGGGPEAILDKNGNVRIGGLNGPELTQLHKGDQIYTAEETKKLFKGKNDFNIPKFSTGYKKPSSQTWSGQTGSSSSSSSLSNKGSSSSASSNNQQVEEEEKWENTYDWLYNLTEDITESLREQTRIERQYDKILKDRYGTSQDLLQNIYEQIDALKKQQQLEEEMIERRKEEMERLIKENSDLNKYATFNFNDQTIEINWDEINKVTDVELGDRIEDYISKLEEIQDEIDQANDSLFDIEDSLEDLEDIGKEDFFDFENRVMDALVSYYQEQIDELSLIDDSINDTNSKLLNSIQDSVSQLRQQRENEKTEDELAEKERRLAYLRQDTSGANQLEIKQLEEEIAQGRESYGDSLVDQKLQELQDQNDLASEQRQLQIELAQAALDTAQKTGDLWKNVQELIKTGTDGLGKLITGSQLDQILKRAESWEALSTLQKMDWLKGIEEALKVSQQYYDKETDDVYGNSYNPNVDYTQLIQDMLASGNIDYHQLAVWEQMRNAKIINEGLDIPLRFEYIDYLDDFDPNVDYTQRVMDYLAQGDYLMAAISQYQRNKKIQELGLDYNLEYDLYPYLFLNNGKNPFLDYREWTTDNAGYIPTGAYNLDTYSSGYNLQTTKMQTYSSDTYYQNSGDNYYEVHIQVDSLSNDYDVDQLARKVEQQINENARYRNVNAINRLR